MPMTRPKTRTATLDAAVKTDIKARFGTFKNAYRVLAPVDMTYDVFQRVAAGRASLPPEVSVVKALFAAWKKANLK